jgi:hypothetical protein
MAEEYTASESGKKSRSSKGSKGKGKAEAPIVLVRVRRGAGGWEAEIREVADKEAASAAETEGFVQVEVPADVYQDYPKWLFHADGRRCVVSNKEEEQDAEGFTDEPPEPSAEDPYDGQVPPAGDAVMQPTSTRGPVPVDRG